MEQLVAGFMFDRFGKEVALIQKARPDWQKGHLNGIGGHVEKGETFHQAMIREFEEETGVHEENWTATVSFLRAEKFALMFYSCFSDKVYDVKTTTDEKVHIVRVDTLAFTTIPIISNLLWLIPLQLDKTIEFPIQTYWKE